MVADVDTNELGTKPRASYQNRAEAQRAVEEFCRAARIPLPTIVSSGTGIHCYWVLIEELDVETWQLLADAFKASCVHYKLKIDPPRSADACSVLRTPTMRHQSSGRIVELISELTGPYPKSSFEHLLKEFLPVNRKRPSRSKIQPRQSGAKLQPTGQSRIGDAARANLFDPSDPAKVVTACRQLGEFAQAPGAYSEPFHYAAAGLFGNCGPEGEQFYLDLLDDDWRATGKAKLDQYLSGGWGPTTCQRFEDLNPGGCAGCPFKGGKITSPIVLGRRYAPIILPDIPPVTLS